MKVKILKPTYVDGKPTKTGDIVETKNGYLLIGAGKATKDFEVPVVEKKPETTKPKYKGAK